MKKAWIAFLFLAALAPSLAWADKKPLFYCIDIEREIDPTSWRYLRLGLHEAEQLQAAAVILHLNTYGGTVVHADSMRTLILNSAIPVYAFIDNNAASAGALIALACDSIYMRSGANMGAATVVGQDGAAMPDKYQSYMRATMRSTAESHGRDTLRADSGEPQVRWRRDPLIAEAMVDSRIVVSGLCDSTKVLTFTAQEALRWNYCEALAENIDEIITRRLGVPEYEIRKFTPAFYDKLVGFLQNPAVQAVLIMLIIGGIYFELQTPGVGLPLAVSIIAGILYFAPLYLSGLAASWEILIFLVGIVLLVLELLVIPGFGIAGIAGLICFFGGLLLALLENVHFNFFWVAGGGFVRGLTVIFSGLLLAVVGIVLLMKRIGRKGLFYRVALHSEQNVEDGYVAVDTRLVGMVGREGVAVTVLRPSGKVRIDGDDYDAISCRNSFIEADTPVKVVKVENMQLYVVPLNEKNI